MSYFAPFPWDPDFFGIFLFLVIAAFVLGGWMRGG